MKTVKTYWYIRHVDEGPVCIGTGIVAWTTGKSSGYVGGIEIMTQFPTRELALSAREHIMVAHDLKFRAKFKIVRVTRHIRATRGKSRAA